MTPVTPAAKLTNHASLERASAPTAPKAIATCSNATAYSKE